MRLKCKLCGEAYHHRGNHTCAKREKSAIAFRHQQTKASRGAEEIESCRETLEELVEVLATGANTAVMVRMNPDLLARLDKSRGGMNRPQKIRAILESTLDY